MRDHRTSNDEYPFIMQKKTSTRSRLAASTILTPIVEIYQQNKMKDSLSLYLCI